MKVRKEDQKRGYFSVEVNLLQALRTRSWKKSRAGYTVSSTELELFFTAVEGTGMSEVHDARQGKGEVR